MAFDWSAFNHSDLRKRSRLLHCMRMCDVRAHLLCLREGSHNNYIHLIQRAERMRSKTGSWKQKSQQRTQFSKTNISVCLQTCYIRQCNVQGTPFSPESFPCWVCVCVGGAKCARPSHPHSAPRKPPLVLLFGVEAFRSRRPPRRDRHRRTGSLDATNRPSRGNKMTVERIFDELGHFKRYQNIH